MEDDGEGLGIVLGVADGFTRAVAFALADGVTLAVALGVTLADGGGVGVGEPEGQLPFTFITICMSGNPGRRWVWDPALRSPEHSGSFE